MRIGAICADCSGCIRKSLCVLGAELTSIYNRIMSTESQNKSMVEENRVDKTVTLVGYVPEGYDSVREFADDVSGRDMFEQETKSRSEFYIETKNSERKEIDQELYDTLKDKDLGEAEVGEEVHEWDTHTNRPYKPFRDHVRDFSTEMAGKLDIGEELTTESYQTRLDSEDSDFFISVYLRADKLKLLKHTSEMEPDDMFVEDSEERPVVKFRVKIKDCHEDAMETIDEDYVGDLAIAIPNVMGFERVRMAACEKETVEQWTCLRV